MTAAVATAKRWRLYARVWMVVQWAEGPDAVERLLAVSEEFGHLVKPEDIRIVPVAKEIGQAEEAQLQIRLPHLHHEFPCFEDARAYLVEHGLSDVVIVQRDSAHDMELRTYGRVPIQPYVHTS